MSSTAKEFLDFAISAYQNANGSEFNYRNSASRAYYSAFHCCYAERSRCPSLKDEDIVGSHEKLYKRFEVLPADQTSIHLKSMAYMARMMKSVRHRADYRLQENFAPDDSKQQIADAKKVMQRWQQLQQIP